MNSTRDQKEKLKIQLEKKPDAIRRGLFFVNIVLVLLLAFSGIYYFSLKGKQKPAEPEKYVNKTFNIQVEVLNACGIKGATETVTNYLRSNHIDVVQAKNYMSFDLEQTLLIDRTGNTEKAENIARMLNIPSNRVISQISKDYLLDVTILIGKDFSQLTVSN
ncbi:MAG: LytR C-terminal domain-containing protein [Ignavibacteria bacterium]|nr:LytR C-terminal domain-containing protein [Ignavibacteria bacterium]